MSQYRWVKASGGYIPDGTVPHGHDLNGEALWVCRAYVDGGLHPGKVRGAFGSARIPYGGRELEIVEYEVLIDAGIWVPDSGGSIPAGAAQWGYEKNLEALFVARAPWGGNDLQPGKIRGGFGAANIPYGGQEVKATQYEVLVGGAL